MVLVNVHNDININHLLTDNINNTTVTAAKSHVSCQG